MINFTKSIICTLIILVFAACDNAPSPTKPIDKPIQNPPIIVDPSFSQYKKLIPSKQIAFCRNLFNGTNLETFKFQNWIAEVDTLSRYGDNKYKVNLETPCSSIETRGKWTVLTDNPIYSQLAKVEKGQAVFISGSYTVTKNSSTVDLNYFSIAW